MLFPERGPKRGSERGPEPSRPIARRTMLTVTVKAGACLAAWTLAGSTAASVASARSFRNWALPDSADSAAGVAGAPGTVQGKLEIGPAGALSVSTSSGEIAVTSSDPSILHTLQDPRMSGREVRLIGHAGNAPGATNSIDVAHVFTVHDGKVFRLRFYCHVCNIPATEPGPCVCCQRWTDLEEIPVSEVTDDMVLVP
jgi:hypothetical protein